MNFGTELGLVGVSYADYENMHVSRHKPAVARLIDYTWAFNDVTVQRVVAAQIAKNAYARKIPEALEELKALDRVAVEANLRNSSLETRKGAEAARRVGGYGPYLAALVYRSIRLGEDSVQVAKDFGVTPWGVRQTLWRLNETAKKLAAGTFKLHVKLTRRYQHRSRLHHGPAPRWDFSAAKKLRKSGLSYKEIAAKWGMHHETVRMAFVRAGIITPRVRRPRRHLCKFNHLEALQLHREGATISELAARYSVDYSTVWWLINKTGCLY